MYYFLGYQFRNRQGTPFHEMSAESKWLRAENTFLLALDGDIDFQPSAVMLLVDLMKRDLRVAAACGRIHPTGSGKHDIDLWWNNVADNGNTDQFYLISYSLFAYLLKLRGHHHFSNMCFLTCSSL